MFKRVFIENEEIVVFMCPYYTQKDTPYLNHWLSGLYKKPNAVKFLIRLVFSKIGMVGFLVSKR